MYQKFSKLKEKTNTKLTNLLAEVGEQGPLYKAPRPKAQLPTPHPLFADLEEGFENEIAFLRDNVLLPFQNKKAYEADGVLSLPKGILFKGTGPARLVVRALANEGGFCLVECEDKDYVRLLNFNSKRSELKDIFRKLEKKAPSIIFIPNLSEGFPKYPHDGDGVKYLLKRMSKCSPGKVVVIGMVPSNDTVISENLTHFPHTFHYYGTTINSTQRKMIVKLATQAWKTPPTAEILENVGSFNGLNGEEQIKHFCFSVYDHVVKKRLKDGKGCDEINPTMGDWKEALDKSGYGTAAKFRQLMLNY